MKILLEDTIPFGKEYLSDLGDVKTYAWQSLAAQDIQDADVMAIRSTTQVNAHTMPANTRLQLVTTATAGTNHLDTAWLASQNIRWNSAGGCNAVAVAEYVVSTLLLAEKKGRVDTSRCTVGIVGAGHVGTALANKLDALGINYKLCDPPLEQTNDSRRFYPLAEILRCDVITLHVPYVKTGPYATGKLIDSDALACLNASQLLINACRGEVIDEQALISRLQSSNAPVVVLDVFNNEPAINPALFNLCWMVTPHIAGHSVEGKVRGTQIVYEQLCQLVNKPIKKQLSDFLAPPPPLSIALTCPTEKALSAKDLAKVMLPVYDVSEDDAAMRQAMADAIENAPKDNDALSKAIANTFSRLRKQYRIRRECSAYALQLQSDTSIEIRQQLSALGFSVTN
ncbi:DUF3410 domain-containing protein [Alteromonas sp. 345S023]|uniref:Erythronate-4-phosphate dehydrogenase n=1 Tax=Alteromonas profundi TaxID=2696062 RepID=A0A7X5LM52_9ALTE|nr:4-phosphoerythronate dehydrogenase [Alteromonas profundi]NDV91916.1 DUF3410 domain-containing protein [Alteromonas profundi]